jgi:hypothetical protein
VTLAVHGPRPHLPHLPISQNNNCPTPGRSVSFAASFPCFVLLSLPLFKRCLYDAHQPDCPCVTATRPLCKSPRSVLLAGSFSRLSRQAPRGPFCRPSPSRTFLLSTIEGTLIRPFPPPLHPRRRTHCRVRSFDRISSPFRISVQAFSSPNKAANPGRRRTAPDR